MKISKKSWHYRYLSRVLYENIPKDFCTYMRTLSGRLLLDILLFIVVPISMVFSVYAAYAAWGVENWLLSLGFSTLITAVLLVSLLIGWAGWTVVIIGIGGITSQTILQYRETKRKTKSSVTRISLIKEWWKAKREKVCPIVEFVDD